MDIANPIGTILAAAMMLRYSFDLPQEADCIEAAVFHRAGQWLPNRRHSPQRRRGLQKAGCREMGSLIIENLRKG